MIQLRRQDLRHPCQLEKASIRAKMLQPAHCSGLGHYTAISCIWYKLLRTTANAEAGHRSSTCSCQLADLNFLTL